MGQQNIIELNGKRYDAITGAVLGAATSHGHARPRTVDGFIRASKVAQPAPRPHAVPAKPATAVRTPTPAGQKKMDVSRRSGTPVKHHQPQKGKTLMRRAVHKPQAALKPNIKVQAPTEIAPASVKTLAKPLAKKTSVANVNLARAARAVSTEQSTKIRRFQPHQPDRSTTAHTARTALHHIATSAPLPVSRPAAFTSLQSPASHRQVPHTPAPTVTKHSERDIFEAAIAHATSHQQPAPRVRRSHSKLAGAVAGIAAFLILGGFITYLNKPGIEMQFASMKVGFQAQLPEYAPTGYALNGGIRSNDGRISVSYRSGDSSYTISQQQSDWNSQTLLENYVTTNAASHQTIESQGRTIYIYNGSNATWVDGGVRYDINGNAPLTANDIVKVASSI